MYTCVPILLASEDADGKGGMEEGGGSTRILDAAAVDS